MCTYYTPCDHNGRPTVFIPILFGLYNTGLAPTFHSHLVVPRRSAVRDFPSGQTYADADAYVRAYPLKPVEWTPCCCGSCNALPARHHEELAKVTTYTQLCDIASRPGRDTSRACVHCCRVVLRSLFNRPRPNGTYFDRDVGRSSWVHAVGATPTDETVARAMTIYLKYCSGRHSTALLDYLYSQFRDTFRIAGQYDPFKYNPDIAVQVQKHKLVNSRAAVAYLQY